MDNRTACEATIQRWSDEMDWATVAAEPWQPRQITDAELEEIGQRVRRRMTEIRALPPEAFDEGGPTL